jgi:hypothetical protein
MPMYRDLLELVPTGEENAVSSLLLWRQLGLWSPVSIKRKHRDYIEPIEA